MVSKSNNSCVYIIDNDSSDGSVKFVRENFPKVKIITLDKNYGFAGGYNKGLKAITEDLICIMNNDIEVTSNWLNPIREIFSEKPNSIIQPTIMDLNNKQYFEYAGASGGFIDKYGYPFCRGRRIFKTVEKNNGQYTDSKIFWASGACMFIQKNNSLNLEVLMNAFCSHGRNRSLLESI